MVIFKEWISIFLRRVIFYLRNKNMYIIEVALHIPNSSPYQKPRSETLWHKVERITIKSDTKINAATICHINVIHKKILIFLGHLSRD
jgi:hypothetical protein